MFFDLVCTDEATDIFVRSPKWGTVPGDATVVSQEVAAAVPIQVLLLFFQHWYPQERQGGAGLGASHTPHFSVPVPLY